MPITKRHDRKTAHKFQGEYESGMILEMLNGTPVPKGQRLSTNQRARLLQVIEDIKTLLEMVGPPWDGIVTDQISDQFQCVNVKLVKYPCFTMFYPTQKNNVQRADGRLWETGDALLGTRPFNESIGVHGVIELAKLGLLNRIQICECGKWYFRRFTHQKFCSPKCRVKFLESSEERKEQKRQRARENYLYKKSHPKRSRGRK
jgi:hypothetical protein